MTDEQNVRAVLESNFAGFKDEIIDIACKRICELTDNPYDACKAMKALESLKSEYNAYRHTNNDYWRGVRYALDVIGGDE